MNVKNPLVIIGKVIWWPFGIVFWMVFWVFLRSGRAWGWLIAKLREAGVPDSSLSQMQANRNAALSGASCVMPTVSQPVDVDGEKPVHAGVCDEANTKREES